MEVEQQIKEKFEALSGYLNEAGLRIWVATEAKVLGRGGISTVSRATGMSRTTIYSGLKDLSSNGSQKPPKDSDRIRIKGGGRKKLIDKDLSLLSDLDALVEPMSRGDPMSPLRWTCKSTPRLAKELKEQGHSVSQRTVCDLLDQLGYSLQSTRKTREGGKNPDRDKQFQYIAEKVAAYQHVGDPVVSVDTKKKELIGDFKNAGQGWHPKGEPEEVRVYDFIDKDLGKVAPYGVYDITANQGWVSVGIDHDTAEFAVESIRRWWREMGSLLYGNTKSILITADCGGSNGYRVRLWRLELQKLADELGLVIRVCHFPPGTSKWNKIEHRMFCHITQNWRGRPLLSRQVVVNLIGNTTTNEGLEIHVALDENHYQAGIKVSDTQLAELSIMRDKFHGEWNYEFTPRQIHEGDNDLL
jgi:transposase